MDASSGGPNRVWVLRRNCALPPGELAIGCLLPGVLGLGVALVFVVAGYPVVAAFAALQMLALGAAFVAYARHADDHETLTLGPDALEVEQCSGGEVRCARFDTAWVRVQRDAQAPALIRVSAAGTEVAVGRHVLPDARGAVERELRAALRTMRP